MNKLIKFFLIPLFIFQLEINPSFAKEKNCSFVFEETDPTSIFFTKELKPTPLLTELLILDGLYEPNDTITDIVRKTQNKWIAVRQGKDQKERSDLIDSEAQKAIAPQVVEIASKMGLFDEKAPKLKKYNYGICLGAFLNGVRSRLALLIDAWEKGIRFESLYFLTGERDLRSGPGEQDDFALLCDATRSVLPFKADWQPPRRESITYNTEYDMVKIIWEQTAIPQSMEQELQGKVFFVDAKKNGAARPSTRDTYILWLQEYHPLPGTILATSHPLLWVHQQLAGMNIVGQKYPLDTISSAASAQLIAFYEKGIVSLILDTVAKCIYEIDVLNSH